MKIQQPLNPYRTGFIARPFEARFEAIERSLQKLFQERGIHASIFEAAPGTQLVITEMMSQLNSAHFGIADITGLKQNILIELGAMIGAGKPLVILRDASDADATLPFDISAYQCFKYQIEGETPLVYDAAGGSTPLRALVESFVDRLLRDRIFEGAREWRGDD
jgi:hypothetical protein